MKPALPGAAVPRSTSKERPERSTIPAGSHASPVTYFLADESTMEAAMESSPQDNCDSPVTFKESKNGLRILPDGMKDKQKALDHVSDVIPDESCPPLASDIIHKAVGGPSPLDTGRPVSLASGSVTPLFLPSPGPDSSLPSSPKSTSSRSMQKLWSEPDMEDVASQAIASSDEDDDPASPALDDSAPQLIMPSIRMPSRRPFTERGKRMGRLKVLIAGDSGIGKTSLIKSIVQMCEEIVHVDPLAPTKPSLPRHSGKRSRSKGAGPDQRGAGTKHIMEVLASTKPYPAWWSDLEESKVLRRRRSMDGTVLERNLCFVDTPGYRSTLSFTDSMDHVIRYVEAQFEKAASFAKMSDSDALSLLGGNGGTQVDVALYLIAQEVKPVDVEFMRRLCPLTNVIPVIAKADTLSPSEIQELKASVIQEMKNANLSPFLFGASWDGASAEAENVPPFAISSAAASDADNMDASLLMSSEYVEPLIPTDLGALIGRVFEADNISWLRHATAKKYVQWRRGSALTFQPTLGIKSPRTTSVSSAVRRHSSRGASPVSLSSVYSSPRSSSSAIGGAPTSYALARLADHTQREETLAQVRLAKWATDLQRSLQNEKLRYESLARGDRAVWLTERLDECISEGALLSGPAEANMALVQKSTSRLGSDAQSSLGSTMGLGFGNSLNAGDPLGLLQWKDGFKSRGWITVQMLGGVGLISGLAFWMTRSDNTIVNWEVDWWHLMG
ncbi:MAG: hypothetical protein M1825_006368 [Sarcosagium campestre]|nr:MAG: hypothetical protein M1825_006368 [Sarcosagium campestre]